MRKHKSISAIVILGLLAVGFILMNILAGFKKEPPRRPPTEVKRYVKTEKIHYGEMESQVTGSGRLASGHQIDVIAEVQGKILPGRVTLKKGQSFKASQLLFRIFDKEAQMNLLARKSRFLNAIANLLPDFKVDFPNSYPHWTSFLGSLDIEKDLPSLPKFQSERQKIFVAGRNILSDYYSIKAEEVRLKKYSVHAPFNGSYTAVNLEVGAVVNPGGRVGRIIRTDKLELEVPVEVHNAHWLQVGDKVQVTTESGAEQWEGTVARKAGFVEATTQSIMVFVSLEGGGENHPVPGSYLKAVFPGIKVPRSMELPRNAVFNSNEVFVVVDGRLAKRVITIHKVDENTLIFSGLEEGLDLVVEPLVNAAENQTVQLMSEAGKAKPAAPAPAAPAK